MCGVAVSSLLSSDRYKSCCASLLGVDMFSVCDDLTIPRTIIQDSLPLIYYFEYLLLFLNCLLTIDLLITKSLYYLLKSFVRSGRSDISDNLFDLMWRLK